MNPKNVFPIVVNCTSAKQVREPLVKYLTSFGYILYLSISYQPAIHASNRLPLECIYIGLFIYIYMDM